jgi:3-oxoacyl-[acyl-carrier-protein] synthase-3
MGFTNVDIVGLEIYHPNNKVENDFFINHFSKMGVDAEPLMKHLGRKERYLANEGENSLTMAFEAAKKAIVKSKIAPEDLDMIIFVSETPEYLVPTNALKLNNMLNIKCAHLVFDMNDNCIGMLTAMDLASRYMLTNRRIKYALIVGSLYITGMVRKDCVISYPNIADGSAAIILQNVSDSKIKSGYIDCNYYTNSMNHDFMESPKCGFSNLHNKDIEENDKKLLWIPHDVSFFSDDWKQLITDLLERNGLEPDDINQYIFSQFSIPDGLLTLEKLGVSVEKTMTIGEKYGYTGCASPFFALHDAIEAGKVTQGDYIVLFSVGAGYTMSAVLLKL